MTLYYASADGLATGTSWQFGMYLWTTTASTSAVFNSWSAFLYDYFVQGTIWSFGATAYMAPAQKLSNYTLYYVDEITDRKTMYRTLAFSAPGYSAAKELPAALSGIILLHPSPLRARTVGRVYLPPESADIIHNGTWDLTIMGYFADFLTDAFYELTSHSIVPVIRDRVHHSHVEAGSWQLSDVLAVHKSRSPARRPVYLQHTL